MFDEKRSTTLYQYNHLCKSIVGPIYKCMLKDQFRENFNKFLDLFKTENNNISELIKEKNIPGFVDNLFELFKHLLTELNDIPAPLREAFNTLYSQKPKTLDVTIENIRSWLNIFQQFKFGLERYINDEIEEEIFKLLWDAYLNAHKENPLESKLNQKLSSHFQNYSYQVYADKAARLGAAIWELIEGMYDVLNLNTFVNSQGRKRLNESMEELFSNNEKLNQNSTNEELTDMQKLAAARHGYPYAQI